MTRTPTAAADTAAAVAPVDSGPGTSLPRGPAARVPWHLLVCVASLLLPAVLDRAAMSAQPALRLALLSAAVGAVQAACGVLLLTRLHRAPEALRRVWRLCGASALCSAGIFPVWSYYAVRSGELPLGLSPADAFYGASVVLSLLAAVTWPTADARSGTRWRYLADGAVLAAALLLLAWSLLIGPGLAGSRAVDVPWTGLVPLAYPVLDLLSVSAAAYAVNAAAPGTRRAAAHLLVTALLLAVADAAFALLVGAGAWSGQVPVMGLWSLVYVVLALGQHGGHLGPARPVDAPGARRGVLGVVLPVLPVLAALLVAVVRPSDRGVVVLGSLLVLLLMLRYTLLALADRRALLQLQSDVLTEAAFLEATLDHITDPVLACDAAGCVRFFNPAMASLRPQVRTGVPVTALLSHLEVCAADGGTPTTPAESFMLRALDGEVVQAQEIVARSARGPRMLRVEARPIKGPRGTLVGAVLVARDITEERVAQDRLVSRTLTDELTGLGNRAYFTQDLDEWWRLHTEAGGSFAVLLLDLDDFKKINDSLGHAAGDRLLVALAARLRGVLRAGDRAARLGGDEFVLLVDSADAASAAAVAKRLLATVVEPVVVDGVDVTPSVSVGIALSGDFADGNELLRGADLAMYQAKKRGKSGFAVFEPHMQLAAQERLSLENDLRRAIRNDDLFLAYQPIVDLATGALQGVEALARWRHPVRGPVSPAEFVPVAEETGLVVPLGEWVLRDAVAQMGAWDAQHREHPLSVSVNVSTRQLERPAELLAVLDDLLERGLDARRLVLEITETALSLDDGALLRALHALRQRGVRLAVDDFGTGYSSLGRLRAAPVHRIKIDRSFVSEISASGASAPIIDGTLAIARGLGLDVVAEGIETEEQLQHLRERGCTAGQGYLLARPLDPEGVSGLLSGEPPWASYLRGSAGPAPELVASPLGALALAQDVPVEDLVRPVLVALQQITGLTSTYVTRLSQDGERQRVEIASSTDEPVVREGDEVAWSDSLCRRALEKGVRRTSDAAAAFPDTDLPARLGIATFVVEPVEDEEGRLLGTLCGAARSPLALDQAHSQAVRLCARLLADRLRRRDPDSPLSDLPFAG